VDGERDLFINYTGADTAWAEWIADTLEQTGHHHAASLGLPPRRVIQGVRDAPCAGRVGGLNQTIRNMIGPI
jgi:hypothetical protein